MFKKSTKDATKDSSTYKASSKMTKSQVNDLTLLIARMQKNADTVEKDVLRAEDLMVIDAENDKKNIPFKYQKENSDCLAEAEGLLKDLFLDLDKAKKMKHPQTGDIEKDVSRLHERWLKDCVFYRELYKQMNEVGLQPRINWIQVFNQKQKEVNSEAYGPTMSELEKQIAAHNILHKEIEAYSTQLSPDSTSSKAEYAELKKQYANLLDNSKWRQHYLNSLYDYMQGCNKELGYLNDEQTKILQQDWSDRMVDPPDVRRRYEIFKNNSLLSHESEVNKLQDDGDRLIEMKHPAANTIQGHRDTLRNEWQKFLNLCICQEAHLDNVEEYKKYQLDAETLSESLTGLSSTLDPKTLSKKSNTEVQLQLEAEERPLQRCEQLLADLRKRSTIVAPLKLRRTTPNRATTIESLCDWNTPKASISRGEKLALKSNSNNAKWDVHSSDGAVNSFPGVCFLIPPPDTEAIDRVDLLGKELDDLKKRRAAIRASLKTQAPETSRAVQSAPLSKSLDSPKAKELSGHLNQLDKDLALAEQDMLNRMRAPLNSSNPGADLSNRLKEQEKAAAALRQLEQQKAAVQKQLEPLISQDFNGPVSSSLPDKLSQTNNKQASLAALNDLYTKKANASLNLENQIRKVDGIVSGYEKQLSRDGPVLDFPNSLQKRNQEVQNLRKDVAAAQPEMQKLNRDLETTEKLCSSLQQGYQEYCPDIRRQEAQVKSLQNRYANLNNQLVDRESLLQGANSKHNDFQNSVQSLDMFLDNLPNNKIRPSDNISEVQAKQTSQERVVEDIKRKGYEVDRMVDLSQDLQDILSEYSVNSDKYRATLKNPDVADSRTVSIPTLSESVTKQEKALVNRYANAAASNDQLLKQMDLAKSLLAQKEETVAMVQQKQQLQQKSAVEVDTMQRKLEEEIGRRNQVENELRVFQDRMLSLKSRKGVERVEEKEVVKYYRDPKIEADLNSFQKKVHEEALNRTGIQSEIEVITRKISNVETELKSVQPKLVTREVTKYERDPQLDVDAKILRDEISRLMNEVKVKESHGGQLKSEMIFLEQKRPTIKEKVVQKEVVRVEKDPEMLKAVMKYKMEIEDEVERSRTLSNQIVQTNSQITSLERLIPTIEPKYVTKEVKKVEQDPKLFSESSNLRASIEEEQHQNKMLLNAISDLKARYAQIELLKQKIDIKEIVNEIYRISPETEAEIARLRREFQDTNRQISEYERKLNLVRIDLEALRSQKPTIEYKEVVQEVVKEERSPENQREIQKLSDQVYSLQRSYTSLVDELNRLKRERDELRIEKSKIETKVVTKEVVKYINDPLLEKEADRLRKEVRDEAQNRRSIEEMAFDLQNKYILLERQRPEEKVVVNEVVRLEKDPMQIIELERLGRTLDEEVKNRRKVELEVQRLRALIEDLERTIRDSEERQKKIQVETELSKIKYRINELENAPPPVQEYIVMEEVLKVERDPKLEKLSSGLRTDFDDESNNVMRLERDIRNLKIQIELVQKEKSYERTIYKEVVRVEKDPAVETQLSRLREQVLQQRNARLDLEDEMRRVNEKQDRLHSRRTTTSQEETNLIRQRDTLLKEKQDLQRQLRDLEGNQKEVSISFQQQSRLMSERSQMNRQKSIKIESDIQRLEREILDEKDRINKRENTVSELRNSLKKEESASETRTQEKNVSTKISILDPETGKDMSPYDAYRRGLIDRTQYINLQELECDWEEITTMGPEGDTSVLQDRKSGKQYSIKNALRDGRLTQYQLQQYKDGKMHISEFALLVAGEKNKPSTLTPVTSQTTSQKPPPYKKYSAEEQLPICGIYDKDTDTSLSVRSALARKMIDPTTAQRLLEAQAATGGIVDINNRERYSVHKAAERSLVESSQLQRLLNAQKAFTGVEDPVTKQRLSIGEAVQKGWLPKDTAMRYMEAQFVTGGLVNPNQPGRVKIVDAVKEKMIDNTMMREIQEEANHVKDIVDPITKQKISYKQAMALCKADSYSGLPMLPAASTDASFMPSYKSHKYSNFS
ncbi:envoplakin a [Tachysurus fulvidraco]|uniref:envoplakin a n=1 Tax=Tachysurus fulvidraco TaxID=1234273 RepID=UPI000F5114A6|nr:envoplakin a [Tachysurus fulvidraco]